MRLLNFKISDDNGAIELDGQGYLDLHNDFLLDELKYIFEERHLELLFTKSIGNWVKDHPFKSIRIIFSDVQVLRMKEID